MSTYEAPVVIELGTVGDVTRGQIVSGSWDGFGWKNGGGGGGHDTSR